MQQIGDNRLPDRELVDLVLHHGRRGAFIAAGIRRNRVVAAVAKPLQMIGSYFFGATSWLKDRATDSFSYFWGKPFDNALARIFVLDREKVLRRALLLANPKMGEVETRKIFESAMLIPAQDKATAAKNAFFLLTQGMRESDRVNLIEAVGSILSNEKDDEIAFTLSLITQNMKISAKVIVLRAVANILAEEREQVVSNVLLLMGQQEVNEVNTVALIQTIADLPTNERNGVTTSALRAVTPEAGGFARLMIFRALANLPAEERDQVVDNALLFVPQGIEDWNNTDELIEAIANIPAHERGGVTVSALQVIVPGIGAAGRVAIIGVVADVPAEEREDVMGNANQIIDDQMEARDRIRVIQRMALAPADQRPNLVQRFREGGDIFLDAPAAAAQGVNVHEGDRDERVVAAINLLRERQGQISKGRMTGAVQEFTKYLSECKMNSEHKRLAEHALQGPHDSADFGPLINGNDTIEGLGISGKEMIARLWIFASGLTELEQAMAKEGIISALKDSYNVGRVCQKGKVQRLIVSVLQGRLADINIELEEGMQVTKEVAAEMFFSLEAHQAIRELPPLIEAANRFCDENPLVNRDEFLREVENYAQVTWG